MTSLALWFLPPIIYPAYISIHVCVGVLQPTQVYASKTLFIIDVLV